MKIDWKHLATTQGYRSLKEAYREDIPKSGRSKEELLRLFNTIISRAKSYSHHTGESVENILNKWEEERTYWWYGYYTGDKFKKLRNKDSLKEMGLKGLRAYYKKHYYGGSIKLKHKMCSIIQKEQLKKSTKEKPRWTKKYKEYKNRYNYG